MIEKDRRWSTQSRGEETARKEPEQMAKRKIGQDATGWDNNSRWKSQRKRNVGKRKGRTERIAKEKATVGREGNYENRTSE